MSQARLESELAECAPGALTAAVWCCSDCPVVRLDFTDTQGRPFLLVAGAPERARVEWYAGLVFGYATILVLPHRAPDAVDEPLAGRTPN